MRRASSYRCVDRRTGSRTGGETMTPTLQVFLMVSAALFSTGLLAALSRRHAIFILIGIEMMLAAANLNFIAFWRVGGQHQAPIRPILALFLLASVAAE